MHIVCPHCTTSYAIDLATLGAAGRTVRCSRCKEVWLARPEDAAEVETSALAMAEAGHWPRMRTLPRNGTLGRQGDGGAQQTPVVDSASISPDRLADGEGSLGATGRRFPGTTWRAPGRPGNTTPGSRSF
jgi:predicted Zn finger-like uncharacterized protein